MMNVVLYQPEIPPNTGNIIRLCANTGARLHLIHPLGFQLTDKPLRRAGLDYHEWADVQQHDSYEAYLATEQPKTVYAFSTKGQRLYTDVTYSSGDTLLFGPETRGLPDQILRDSGDNLVTLPMRADSRSLNLSNTVAIAVYHVWHQLGFEGAL